MDLATVRQELAKSLSQELLHGSIPARLAYRVWTATRG
jgi:hypothetical protein